MVCKCGFWLYFREDYTRWREASEDILLGLGMPDLPVEACATEPNHSVRCGEHEDAFAQSWAGQILRMSPPYSMFEKAVHKLTEDGASAIMMVPN